MKRLSAVLIVLLAPAIARAAAADVPRAQLPDTVVPVGYRLSLDIDPRHADFAGEAEIAVTLRSATATVWLHGLGIKVARVTAEVDGRRHAGRYEEVEHDFGVARVVFAAPLPAGPAVLRFRYRAPFQQAAQGLYRTRVGNDWYAFSQLEAIDARRVFPGFDEPRFKTPFDVTIVTHGADLAVSNAPETRSARLWGGTTRHDYQTTRPLPTYLLAFAVGPLDIATGAPLAANGVRAEPLPLRIIGTRGKAAKFAFALRETPKLVAGLEEYLGIAFPYPKLDLIASPIQPGAMENAGAIIFGEGLLAMDATPTAREQSGFAVVAAHELAHQWFGDLVTPLWWDDIWLNESFAEWMGSKIADAWQPGLGIDREQLDQTLNAMATDALSAGRPVHELITDNAQIGTTFDEITYQKGAGVIGMVESYLGPDRFRRGVQLHLTRHAYGGATAGDFFAAMAEAAGDQALVDAFRSFVDQPGVPLLRVAVAADGSLQIEQSRYRPLGPTPPGRESWHVPFCASVYAGADATKVCMLLGDRTSTLALPAAARNGTVFPNAGGVGYYRFTIDAALLRQLLAIAPALPAREALALADSVGAAFDAGQLSFADLYSTARVLAQHPDVTAKLSLGYRLEDLHNRFATAAERPLLERALVVLYGDRLRELGYDTQPGRYSAEPAARQLERRYLIGLVGLTGRDPEVRQALAQVAPSSLADPGSVEPLLRWRIWAIGLQERGAALLAPLKALLASDDAQVRQGAGTALSYAEAPALLDASRALVLDPRVDMGLAFQVLGRQLANPVTRDGTWRWLDAHREAVVARVPAMLQGFLADLGAGVCTAAGREFFENALGQRLRGVSGGEIAVARALERIDDCVALRAAVAGTLETTLAVPPPVTAGSP
jgi:hypothetical protein